MSEIPRWAERAEEELEEQYANGDLSQHEFNDALTDLRHELEDAAHESAQAAYDDVMNNW